MKKNKHAKKQDITIFGNTFIAIPRKVIYMLSSPDQEVRQTGKLLLALIGNAYHSDAYKYWQGNKYRCKRGEYIGSLRELERMTGISRRVISKIIHTLVAGNLIEFEKINRGSRIYLTGYLEFLSQFKPSRETAPLNPGLILEGLPTQEQMDLLDTAYNLLTT